MAAGPSADATRAMLDEKIAAYKAAVVRYGAEKNDIKAQAEGYQADFDRLNIRDDQLDMAEALISVSIALFGITALTKKQRMFWVSGAFASLGVVLGLAAVWRGPASSFIFDKSAGTFALRRRTVIGFGVREGRLPDIAEVRFTQRPGRGAQEGASRVSLVLASGERLALSGGAYGGEGKQYAVDTLRRFLALRPADPARARTSGRRSVDARRFPYEAR
jgi:hypothetical protein